MTNSRLSRRNFLEGSAGLGIAASLFPEPGRAQAAGIVRVRSYSDLQVLDPAFTKAAPEGDIAHCLFRSLIQFKSSTSWEWELDAAEKIDQIDPTTVAFTLKPGMKWTGGYGDLTAEDVKYSFERIADPAMKSPYKGDWATLDRVEVKGPLEGVIHLKERFAPLWWSTLPWTAGMILCRKAMEAAGGKFTTQPPAV